MSGSTAITPTSAPPPKLNSDVIITDTCCGNFIYNVPRAAVLITLPGIIILVIGAILLACTDRSLGWFDGDALICTIFLILGGAWTLGALTFWAVNWCQNRPKGPSPRGNKSVTSEVMVMTSEGGQRSLELTAVHRVPEGDSASVGGSAVSLPGVGGERVFTVSRG